MPAIDYLKTRNLEAKQVGNKLRVWPKDRITNDDRKYITLHRMEILADLAANDGEDRRAHWSIHVDGKRICTVAGGPMTRREALDAATFRWPNAQVD